jgi:hypothetical protein
MNSVRSAFRDVMLYAGVIVLPGMNHAGIPWRYMAGKF